MRQYSKYKGTGRRRLSIKPGKKAKPPAWVGLNLNIPSKPPYKWRAETPNIKTV